MSSSKLEEDARVAEANYQLMMVRPPGCHLFSSRKPGPIYRHPLNGVVIHEPSRRVRTRTATVQGTASELANAVRTRWARPRQTTRTGNLRQLPTVR